MREQSHLSLEYVHAAVTATEYDGTPIDPATLTVQFAIVPVGTDPTALDWYDTTRITGNIFGLLVGPGGTLELGAGDYDTWHHIPDSPEDERAQFGKLRIT